MGLKLSVIGLEFSCMKHKLTYIGIKSTYLSLKLGLGT